VMGKSETTPRSEDRFGRPTRPALSGCLRRIRRRIVAGGQPLLSWLELDCELSDRVIGPSFSLIPRPSGGGSPELKEVCRERT
jgi:hypothetical protein